MNKKFLEKKTIDVPQFTLYKLVVWGVNFELNIHVVLKQICMKKKPVCLACLFYLQEISF